MTRVWLPSALETIGEDCFSSNHKLEEICLSQSNPHFTVENGILFDKQQTRLIAYPAARSAVSYTVPDTVTRIESSAFCKAENLTRITLPDHLSTIGHHAFDDCGNLNSVNLPDALTRIEEGAFMGCQSLEDIVLPDHLVYLGGYAFDYCGKLERICIPAGVDEIGSNPFRVCTSLSELTVAEENSRYYAVSGILFDREDHRLIYYPLSAPSKGNVTSWWKPSPVR